MKTDNSIVYNDVNSEDDYIFILNRCKEECRDGHFNPEYIKSEQALNGLAVQMDRAVKDKPFPFNVGNPRDGVLAKIQIIRDGGERVGFFLLLEEVPGSWRKSVEIHMFSLSKGYRRKGIGRAVLADIIHNLEAKKIYARCYSKSDGMIKLLIKLKFKVKHTSIANTKTLIYHK